MHNERQRVLEAERIHLLPGGGEGSGTHPYDDGAEEERFTRWVAESEASAPGRGHAGWDEPRLGLLERLATRLARRHRST